MYKEAWQKLSHDDEDSKMLMKTADVKIRLDLSGHFGTFLSTEPIQEIELMSLLTQSRCSGDLWTTDTC